jgi:hypothetical protein
MDKRAVFCQKIRDNDQSGRFKFLHFEGTEENHKKHFSH